MTATSEPPARATIPARTPTFAALAPVLARRGAGGVEGAGVGSGVGDSEGVGVGSGVGVSEGIGVGVGLGVGLGVGTSLLFRLRAKR